MSSAPENAVPDAAVDGADAPPARRRQPSPLARATAIYTTIRLAVFAVVWFAIWPAQLNPIVQLAIALVGSGLFSYPLARKQRAEMAELYAARHQSPPR